MRLYCEVDNELAFGYNFYLDILEFFFFEQILEMLVIAYDSDDMIINKTNQKPAHVFLAV